jgi:hypothetical protein
MRRHFHAKGQLLSWSLAAVSHAHVRQEVDKVVRVLEGQCLKNPLLALQNVLGAAQQHLLAAKRVTACGPYFDPSDENPNYVWVGLRYRVLPWSEEVVERRPLYGLRKEYVPFGLDP